MTCPRCQAPLAHGLVRFRWPVRIAAALLLVVVSWAILGPAFHHMIEGMEPRSVRSPWLLVPLVALLVTVVAWTLRVAGPACTTCGWTRRGPLFAPLPAERTARLAALPARRRVLRQMGGMVVTATAAAAGAFGTVMFRNRGWIRVGRNIGVPVETMAPRPRPAWADARVRRYRRLGRTGAMVSDISLGSARITNVDVARLALDRGVNYFDTAPDYARHGSEEILGQAMRGRRDQVFVATKFCTADGHLPPETPVARIVEAVEGSLRRLQTDHVDLVHIHSCDRVERLLAPTFHEAFDRLKAAGKARFLGVSSHTPNLSEVAHAALESGRFDVLMLAYHFGMGWDLDDILTRAAERDVGVVAMKTLKGAKHRNLADFRDDATSYTQAAFRWVLSNPRVSCLVVSFSEPQQVDEYLYASGTELAADDHRVLARYDALASDTYCRPHCGACLDACPERLPIHDVLRYRMYFEDYGMEKEAMRKYARLDGHDASRCAGCPAPCADTCPYGLRIQERMIGAHERLALA
jgi:aryl-alcohol dehydrogenase-like predicted oxidoreductase